MKRREGVAFTLVELLVVIFIIAVLVAVLIPVIGNIRKSALRAKMEAEQRALAASAPTFAADAVLKETVAGAPPVSVLASVSTFDAAINLTPRLSVGTDQPESIYEATLTASLSAGSGSSDPARDSTIVLPLPPQIISLGDVKFTVNGEPAEDISLAGDKLIWRGPLLFRISDFDIRIS